MSVKTEKSLFTILLSFKTSNKSTRIIMMLCKVIAVVTQPNVLYKLVGLPEEKDSFINTRREERSKREKNLYFKKSDLLF